jgi:hypothetical protein
MDTTYQREGEWDVFAARADDAASVRDAERMVRALQSLGCKARFAPKPNEYGWRHVFVRTMVDRRIAAAYTAGWRAHIDSERAAHGLEPLYAEGG